MTESQAASLLGRKGGKARAQKLTPERRSAIAQRASLTRWGRNRKRRKRKKDLTTPTLTASRP